MTLTPAQLALVAGPFRDAVLCARLDSESGVNLWCGVCQAELRGRVNSQIVVDGLVDAVWAAAAKVLPGRLLSTVNDAFIRSAFKPLSAASERLQGEPYHMRERARA